MTRPDFLEGALASTCVPPSLGSSGRRVGPFKHHRHRREYHIASPPRSFSGRLTCRVPQINHDVTPDSLLLLHAAREVVEEEGFDEQLDDVRDRVDEIESLHRTRELTVRAPFRDMPFSFPCSR